MCVFVAFIVLKVCFSWNQLALSVEQKLTLPWLRSKGAQTILSDLTEKSKSFNLVASSFYMFIGPFNVLHISVEKILPKAQ